VRMRRLLVALVERTGSRRPRRGAKPAADPETEAEPEAVIVSVPAPELEGSPEPPHEPEPVAVPLALDPSPRTWNLWDLERLAEEMNGDSRAEERALLLRHMREFADPSGNLPLEFDPLVRDAFGAGLAELVT
jgi:hypothetical protein